MQVYIVFLNEATSLGYAILTVGILSYHNSEAILIVGIISYHTWSAHIDNYF